MNKKSIFDRIDDAIMRFEVCACYIMLAFMILIVFANAMARLIGLAIDWTTDLAQLLFAWVSVFGADMAMKKSRHIGVDLITKRLPAKANKYLRVGIYCACIVFLCTAAYYGTALSIQNKSRLFHTLGISHSWVTMAIPVGFVLMTYTIIRHIVFILTDKKNYYEDKLEDKVNLEDN